MSFHRSVNLSLLTEFHFNFLVFSIICYVFYLSCSKISPRFFLEYEGLLLNAREIDMWTVPCNIYWAFDMLSEKSIQTIIKCGRTITHLIWNSQLRIRTLRTFCTIWFDSFSYRCLSKIQSPIVWTWSGRCETILDIYLQIK